MRICCVTKQDRFPGQGEGVCLRLPVSAKSIIPGTIPATKAEPENGGRISHSISHLLPTLALLLPAAQRQPLPPSAPVRRAVSASSERKKWKAKNQTSHKISQWVRAQGYGDARVNRFPVLAGTCRQTTADSRAGIRCLERVKCVESTFPVRRGIRIVTDYRPTRNGAVVLPLNTRSATARWSSTDPVR